MSMLLYAHYVISDEHAVICTLWYKWWACCYAKYVISDEHAVIHTVLSLNTLLSSLQEYSTLLEKNGENWYTVSKHVYWWGGVKVIYRWHFNILWLSLQPISKYLLKYPFSLNFSISAWQDVNSLIAIFKT